MPYILILILITALPILTVVGWWRATKGTVRGDAEHVVVTGIWSVLQFSGGLAALGWLGILSAPAAFLTQAVLTTAVWVVSSRRSSPAAGTDEPLEHQDDPAPPPDPDWLRRVFIGVVVIGVVTGALLVARTIWYGMLLPIDSSDGSTYHLPILIEALRNGQFGRPPAVWTFGWTSPKSTDMAFLWLMLGGNLDLVLFGQLLFLPLAIASTAALAVWAGVRRHVAWAFGATILFLPIVVVQATTAYVDIAAGALFLAAIAATVLYRAGKLTGAFGILTVFASVGLAAGSKYSFLVAGTILLIIAFWPDVRHWRLTWAHAFGILVLLVGSHWYLAPIIWYGNPAWPYAMPFLPKLFPNYLDTVDAVVQRELAAAPALMNLPWFIRPLVVWVEAGPLHQTYTFDSRQAGLGPLWFILLIPAILAWILIWVREGRYRDMFLVGGIIAVSFLIQTYQWWTRFTWWIAGLGILAAAVVFERSSSRVRIAIATFIVVTGLYVLAFTNVQVAWTAPKINELMAGVDPVLVAAGEAVAFGHQQDDEIIAVPGLAWGSWNTYLLGHDFGNSLVIVPPGEGLEERIRASGATMLFDPAWPIAWPEESLLTLDSCLEEVGRDDVTDQSIHWINCP